MNGTLLEFRLLPFQFTKKYFTTLLINHLNDEKACVLSRQYYNKKVLHKMIDYEKLKDVSRVRESRRPTKPRKQKVLRIKTTKILQVNNESFLPQDTDIKIFISPETGKFIKNAVLTKLTTDFAQQTFENGDAKTFFACSDHETTTIFLPYFHTHYDKQFVYRFLQIRMDTLPLNASLVGRHRHNASFENKCCTLCKCNLLETREHFLLECPKFAMLRHNLSASLLELACEDEISLNLLLNNLPPKTRCKNKIYDIIHDYLCDILRIRGLM